MEPIFAVILLLLAVFAIFLAWRRLRESRGLEASPTEDLNATLPKIGAEGSVSRKQLKRLKAIELDKFDLSRLSEEQASVLLNADTYISHVWEKEKGSGTQKIDPRLRDLALDAILAHASYIERVNISEEMHYETREEEIPEDACYWHVVSILKGTS